MSFEQTKVSINNLSNMDVITLDLLFDMMVCVSQDVMTHNQTKDLSETPVADMAVLLKKVYNLMLITVSAYKKNKDGVSEFGSTIQERYTKLVEDMDIVLSEIAGVKETIEKAEAKEEEVKAKQSELLESRGHLLTIGDECDALQRQIDILSDSALDEKAKEKESLETDLAQRKSTAETLEKEKGEYQAEIDKASERIQSTKNVILTLQKEKEELGNEENSLLKEKNRLEKGIENLKHKLKEYKEWIDNYPTMSAQVQAEHDEEKAKITVMINAFNSVVADNFLRETLFKTAEASDNLSVKDYPDWAIAEAHIENIEALQAWFGEMSKRINGLIEVYEIMLQAVVSQSDQLTKEFNA